MVLSDLVSKLTSSPNFQASMFQHVSTCIQGLKGDGQKGRQSQQSNCLLTGIAALFLPPKEEVSLRKACQVLEINRNSKYVKMVKANRVDFDHYITLLGYPLSAGNMVSCQGGYGELKEIDEHYDSITISLHPWKCDQHTARNLERG